MKFKRENYPFSGELKKKKKNLFTKEQWWVRKSACQQLLYSIVIKMR